MFLSWYGRLLRFASWYGWCDVLEPVGLRSLIEKVSPLDLEGLPSGLDDVVGLGREWEASLQELKNQWYEGRQLVYLKFRNTSPSVVHSERCRCLWMWLVSAVIIVDGDCSELCPLQLVRLSFQ